MTWMPIETAPKDGRAILLAHRLADDETDVFVDQGVFLHGNWWAANTDIDPPGFMDVYPDFWMPLPAPPQL